MSTRSAKSAKRRQVHIHINTPVRFKLIKANLSSICCSSTPFTTARFALSWIYCSVTKLCPHAGLETLRADVERRCRLLSHGDPSSICLHPSTWFSIWSGKLRKNERITRDILFLTASLYSFKKVQTFSLVFLLTPCFSLSLPAILAEKSWSNKPRGCWTWVRMTIQRGMLSRTNHHLYPLWMAHYLKPSIGRTWPT